MLSLRRFSFVSLTTLTGASLTLGVLAAGCSSKDTKDDSDGSNGPTTPSAAAGTGTGTVFDVVGGDSGDTSLSASANECGGLTYQAEQTTGQVDIIFIIDNSSSMQDEIAQVEQRINQDFAQIIEATGTDYRVIMISRYGEVDRPEGSTIGETDYPICISSPLGNDNCENPDTATLSHNPPRFYHFSADVRSREMFCDALEAFSAADELTNSDQEDRVWTSIAPNGYSEFLREGSHKNFVVITDDNSDCSRMGYNFGNNENAAEQFDEALRDLSPDHFGTGNNRRYTWHSIVGMVENDPPDQAWQPGDPINNDQCGQGDESVGPGTGFQALSRMTGGLRYPSCRHQNFDAIFTQLAAGVIASAVPCEWQIPPAPGGGEVDPATLNVELSFSGGAPDIIPYVENPDDCGGELAWYFDDPSDPSVVLPCPSTCDAILNDALARVDIKFGCVREDLLK